MNKPKSAKSETSGIDPAILAGLPVTVEALLGMAKVKVSDLSALKPGDSFTLDRRLGAPVELKVNGITLAYGDLVAVGDNFGVRITEIASE